MSNEQPIGFFKKLFHIHNFKGDIKTAKLVGICHGVNLYHYESKCKCGKTKTDITNELWNI